MTILTYYLLLIITIIIMMTMIIIIISSSVLLRVWALCLERPLLARTTNMECLCLGQRHECPVSTPRRASFCGEADCAALAEGSGQGLPTWPSTLASRQATKCGMENGGRLNVCRMRCTCPQTSQITQT